MTQETASTKLQFVPVRLGFILKMLRTNYLKQSIDKASTDWPAVFTRVKKKYTENFPVSINFSTAAWSAYEIGTRTPSEEVARSIAWKAGGLVYLVKQDWQKNPFKSQYEITEDDVPGIEEHGRTLMDLYYQETLMQKLSEYFPLRCLAAQAVANFLVDSNEIPKQPPFPEAFYVNEARISVNNNDLETFIFWFSSHNDEFRSRLARAFIFKNRFTYFRYAGANLSPAEVEKFFLNNRVTTYTTYNNALLFSSEALTHGLFVEHPGPAIDIILALAKEINISEGFKELSIKIYTEGTNQAEETPEKIITVPAMWGK